MSGEKKITELPLTKSSSTSSVIPIIVSGVTSQISKNDFLNNIGNFTGNTDGFDAFTQRTIFSRSSIISYSEGVSDVNFLSGTSTNSIGTVTFPTSYFQNSPNYRSKIIHFRVVGKTGAGVNNETINVSMSFGGQSLTGSSIGDITVDFFQNKPFEISGELIFNNSQVIVCYSLGYCDQTSDFRKVPLSDPTIPQTISGFTGGNLNLNINSGTTIGMTTYYGYVQSWN
jgi:hypothetical protein